MCTAMSRHLSIIQGGFTSTHSIVTAATVHGQPVYYRKGGVATHSSVYVHIINSQWLKFNAVNGQSPKNQHGQCRKELAKVLTCSCIESMEVTPPAIGGSIIQSTSISKSWQSCTNHVVLSTLAPPPKYNMQAYTHSAPSFHGSN